MSNTMDNIIKLSGALHTCPVYWQNFMNHNWDILINKDPSERGQYLDYVLKTECNAAFADLSDISLYTATTIEFRTPEDKTWFILKWS